MKKCIHCDIIFHTQTRLTCIYCDSTLLEATEGEIRHIYEKDLIEKEAKERGKIALENPHFFVGSYFKVKSFLFVYNFFRNQFKTGKEFKRFFVQPIDLSYVIRIPWIVIDVIDSLAIRLSYRGFCPACNWKYNSILSAVKHPQTECDYNKEYTNVVSQILNGEIVKNIDQLEREATEKSRKGQPSAYCDLCLHRKNLEVVLDFIMIFLSIGIFILLMARWIMPIFGWIYDF